jgi:hypothetical protein
MIKKSIKGNIMKRNIVPTVLLFYFISFASLYCFPLEDMLSQLNKKLSTLQEYLKGKLSQPSVLQIAYEASINQPAIPPTTTGDAWKKPTKEGYRYRDENQIRDKRKIVVFAYGSLINQKKSPSNKNKLKAGPFVETNIKVPVSLKRISSANTENRRATLIIDNESKDTRNLWAAFSKFAYLPNARNNLAAREGTAYNNQQEGYNLRNIFYMKKLLSGQTSDVNEIPLQNVTGNWVVRGGLEILLPSDLILRQMAEYANKNGADAAIWAAFPSNTTWKEVLDKLRDDRTFWINTIDYIGSLPDPKTALENKFLFGRISPIGYPRLYTWYD